MASGVITYRTIVRSSEAQHRVLGSRHLAFVYPVHTEEEIKAIVEQLWKEHHNATHICYAWRLGWDKSKFRMNDDGEPSGTAGRPIFGQIQSFDLTNVLAVVIRYFGGTKLGTGGLIDAYKTATKLAIEASEIAEKEVMDRFIIQFGHEQMPGVMKLLKEMGMEKIDARFDLSCELEFRIKKEFSEKLTTALEEMGLKAPVFVSTE